MKTTIEDYEAIRTICERFEAILQEVGDKPGPRMDLVMDLECAHEDCPMDFQGLSKADDFNLYHDVFGIRQHLDRQTRKLGNCFLPRFARH